MSLENLVGISLESIAADRAAIKRLLAAGKRNIADSHVAAISAETRFDAAYKAIVQLAGRCRRFGHACRQKSCVRCHRHW